MKISGWFRIYRVAILLLILTALILRIPILKARFFDPDEFQHLHGARQIYHGQLPYRDYFEHHTPFLHFILSGFYPVFGEEIRILFAARALMMIFTAAILYLTYSLTKTLYKTDAGLFAALFLSYVIMFLEKTIEVRPDMPAVTFWLASLIFMVKGIRRNSASFAPRHHMLSGLMVGIAVMFTQKSLFALGGMLVALAWMFFDPRSEIPRKRSLKLIAVFLASAVIPTALTCGYFYVRGGLWEFINCNFIMNSRWKVKFWPFNYIKQMLRQNPFFSSVSILGLLSATFWFHKRKEMEKGNYVPVLCTYTLIGGLFILPVPYRQYYLLFLPLLAVYCGFVFGQIAGMDIPRLVSDLRNGVPRPLMVGFMILGLNLAAAVLIYALDLGKPIVLNSRNLYLLLWACVIVFTALACVLKRGAYAALILSIGIVAYPLDQTVDQFSHKNNGQLASVKHIMKITDPVSYTHLRAHET